jgi:regulator of chromosome condensation
MQAKGSVFVFGDGDCGQLGLGEDITERLRPAPLDIEGKKVVQIVCGGMHTVAMTSDNTVYSWGVNDEGALGRPTADKLWNESPEGEEYSERGDPYVPGIVLLPRNAGKVVQLSAGDSHTCALMDDGSIWSWGTFRDASGVMGFSVQKKLQLVPTKVYAPQGKESPAAVCIASGADHVCAVTEDGRLISWGSGQQGQLGRVGSRMSDRMKLVTFLTPTVVPVKSSKGGHSTKVTDVACGTYSTFVTLSDGTIYVCGLNNYGQLGLKGDDIVFSLTKVPVPEKQRVTTVCPGQHHTLFITDAGGLLSCGRPTYGRLGRKDADVSSDNPGPEIRPVDGLEGINVVGACAGLAVSGCFDANGSAYLWGFGTSNQLAKGDDDEDEIVPRKVAETKRFQGQKVLQCEFGGQHAAFLCV